MKCLFIIMGIVCIAWGTSVASEEEILSPHKVTITADGGKAFGEVSATLETSRDAIDRHIKSIILVVGGKEFVVPKDQFGDLRSPLIETAEFRMEAGYDKHPWLYLTFQLAMQSATSTSDRPRVYIKFQNGKLVERSVQQPRK